MDKYYFFLVRPEMYNQIGKDICTFERAMYRNVQKGFGVLFVDLAGPETILPYLYEITELELNPTVKVTLRLIHEYNEQVAVQRFLQEIHENRAVGLTDKKLPDGFTDAESFAQRLSVASILRIDMPKLIEVCTSLMKGDKDQSERRILFAIGEYIQARGYYFDPETLANYHICLKTRPFVILAGLSGTGKSKLSQLYGEALGCGDDNYLRLAVRPNWNDDRYLIGYFNTLSNEYFTERAIEFVMDANNHPEKLYIFCLDEMNLAHVEHYFSQFLSAMEEDRIEKRSIRLMSKHLHQRYRRHQANGLLPKTKAQGLEEIIPEEVRLPTNLLFTGTINVDETTQSISDKVIDRANTIEFFKIEVGKMPHFPPFRPLQPFLPQEPEKEPLQISAAEWQRYRVTQPDISYRNRIEEIEEILNCVDIGFGYRVIREIELYLANSRGLLEPDVAFDLQVKQRILPRIRGTEVIADMLNKLTEALEEYRSPRSLQRVEEMKKRLERDGYTSFWR